jgi:(p)ppGpp synthase/HD superfamily hydrolase
MATKHIPINPADKNFAKLMRDVNKGILEKDTELVNKVKAEFAKADISLFFNEEKGLIRVLQAGRPPIDFPFKGKIGKKA